MSILSTDELKVLMENLGLLSEKDYRDRSPQLASKHGVDVETLDLWWEGARKKHLKEIGAKSGSVFFGFASIDDVRKKMAELKPNVTNDLAYVYEDPYLQVASALEHYDPGEFARLVNNLKSGGLKSWERWESTVRRTARPEADRIRQQRPPRRSTAGGGSFAGGQQVHAAEPLIDLPEVKPAAAPVLDAAALFDDIRRFVRRFVVLSAHQLIAVVLWIAFTHAFEVADVSTRLAMLSPKKRCGKTTLLRVLGLLSIRPLSTSNISPAAIFRTIDQLHPTLLLDEGDTFAGRATKQSERSEEIRGILNSGHTKDTAFVIRNEKVGNRWIPRKFSTWTPICYAAIGRLPDTWEDRSIKLMVKRRLYTEMVEKLTRRNLRGVRAEAEALQAQLARWTRDSLDALRQADPKFPPGLNDRAEDNWDLLLAIADQVGPDWGKAAREAANALSADRASDVADEGLDIRLLADIKTIVDEDKAALTTGSTELRGALVALKEAPWGSMPRTGKPLTTTRLALMLRPFEVYPKDTGGKNGFVCSELADAFARYLTSPAREGSSPADENPSEPAPPDTMSSGAFQPSDILKPSGGMGQNGDFQPSIESSCGGFGEAQFIQRGVGESERLEDQNGLNDRVAGEGSFSDGSGPSPDDRRKAQEEADLDRLAKADGAADEEEF